jgi:hypothetical protein
MQVAAKTGKDMSLLPEKEELIDAFIKNNPSLLYPQSLSRSLFEVAVDCKKISVSELLFLQVKSKMHGVVRISRNLTQDIAIRLHGLPHLFLEFVIICTRVRVIRRWVRKL